MKVLNWIRKEEKSYAKVAKIYGKSKSSFCFKLFIYLFRLRWVFVAVRGLSLVAASRGYSSLRCVGFSLQWLLLLQSTGSRRVGFSSCGAGVLLLCGMWDVPGPGIEPVSPALAGGFLTTVPPGKSQNESSIGEIVMKEKEPRPSFAVTPQTAKVMATVCAEMEKTLLLYHKIF